MTRAFIIMAATIAAMPSATAQTRYGKYFQDRTLCIQYTINGQSDHCSARIDTIKTYNGWAGSRHHLATDGSPSDMSIIINDNTDRRTIYRQSYSTLFSEWQETRSNNPSGDYKESARMPLPKRPSTLYLTRNYTSGRVDTIFTTTIDPRHLPHPTITACNYKVTTLHTARTRRSINIAILPEGFTEGEMEVFLEAARNMTKHLFEYEPFSSHYRDFNIRAVLAPSPESGVDIPSKGIERNTLMDFSYDTFGIQRYIGTRNHWAINELASCTYWDHAIVLVNSDRYGGGGIYNFYSVFPAGNPQIAELFIHEFGHAFANLPDEYAEPGNPIAPDQESDRDCIMKSLYTHFYCNECKAKVTKVILQR